MMLSSSFEAQIISGKLPSKNSKLEIATTLLKIDRKKKFRVYHLGKRSFIETDEFVNIFEMVEKNQRSYYYALFRNGATIYPRQLWFIDIVLPPARVGMNPKKLNAQTSSRARDLAKKEYEDVEIKGQVENQFVFRTVTGSELVPFNHLELPICILPIEETEDAYRMIRSSDALAQGNRGLGDWLVAVEHVWDSKRGEKLQKSDVYDWLNYSNKLTNQSPSAHFRVLYNASGSYVVACVARNVRREVTLDGGVKIKTSGLIADHTTYCWETDNEDEAQYVSAFLNAPIIDRLLKPLQAVGNFGPRHIHKKVLELPIPQFDPDNGMHKELSDLAKSSESKTAALVTDLTATYASVGKIRSEIKRALNDDLNKINSLALHILESGRLKTLENFSAKDS